MGKNRLYVIKREGNHYSVNSAGFKSSYDELPDAAKWAGADWQQVHDAMNKNAGTVFVSIPAKGEARVF